MSLADIKELPVGRIMAEDAVVALWVTNASLRDGYDVLETWGFTPTTSLLTWVKWPRLGLGRVLRNCTEHVLIGTRGRPVLKYRSQPSWFTAPTEVHSQKPGEQFALWERLFDGPYVELFARRRPTSAASWHVWGNEIASDLILPGFPVPTYSALAPANDHRTRDELPEEKRT
jgi:N6-adenosine-specific RNA methylase IME4